MKKPGPKDLRQGIFPLAARIPGFLIIIGFFLLRPLPLHSLRSKDQRDYFA